MSNRFIALIYFNGEIVTSEEGVTFQSDRPKSIRIDENISIDELKVKIETKINAGNRSRVSEIKYRLPVSMGEGCVRYRTFPLEDDDDVRCMFDVHQQFPNVGVIELYADVEDINHDGGSSYIPPVDTQLAWPVENPECQPTPDAQLMNNFYESFHYSSVSPTLHSAGNDEPHNSIMTDSPIRGVEIEGAEPSSYTADPEMSFGAHGDYVGDFSEPEQYVESDDSDDNNDPDPDVAVNINVPLSSSTSGATHFVHPCEPASHMRTLDLDAMHSAEFPEYAHILGLPRSWNASTGDLCVGMQFNTKEAVVSAIKHYSIKNSVDYRVIESSPNKYHGQCVMHGSGCNWSIRATLSKKKQIWEIRKYIGPHTCTYRRISQDHMKLDSSMICSCILSLVEANPAISVPVLVAEIRNRYGYMTSYRKAWIAKQKAIVRLFGDWDKSYNDLPKWLGAMQHFVPGTVVELQTVPAYHGQQMVQGISIFHRLFWTFKSCIEGFLFCKPVVQIDGTFLYGKYKGTLLLAVAQDGNRNIVPIAFAIVEGETKEAWSFFLSNLRRHVVTQDGICLISDRHESIKSVIRDSGNAWKPPRAYSVYCIRHIAANFMRRFNNKELRRQVVNMAYELRRPHFQWYYENLRAENPEAADWLDRIPKEKWAQSYDEGRRYGHMTTNLAECINSVLKGTRHLPITALVKATYFRLAELFRVMGNKQTAMMAAGHSYCETVAAAMQENRRKASSHFVRGFTRSNQSFMVEELENPQEGVIASSYKVNLNERWCDCGKFQAHRYPCSHVVAACAHVHIDCMLYVDNIYRLETINNVYRYEFQPVGHESYWPEYHGEQLCPNPEMRRDPKGRPKSSRIRNEMDLRERGQPKRCGLCRNEGHSRNKCPYRVGSSGESSRQ